MMPNPKIDARSRAPPENMLNISTMVVLLFRTNRQVQQRQYQESAQKSQLGILKVRNYE